MRMSAKTVMLRGGKAALIRSADIKDAPAVCTHLAAVAVETPFLLNTAEEASGSVLQQARRLRRRALQEGCITLCAFVDGQLAAMATVSPYGRLYRTAHRATMSISVKKAYWGLGLGSALMQEIVDFSDFCGYRQLELGVDERNLRAIKLYERFGFKRVGLTPAALKQDDGSYCGELIMFKDLNR